jgi:Skp family chaperone for outer membrane proteins
MRRVLLALGLLVACAHGGGPKPAATGPATAVIDIGIVDLRWVLMHTRDGQETSKRLRAWVSQGGVMRQKALEAEETELRRIFRAMDPVLQQIARARGLRFVLEITDGGVLYARPELDVSSELAALYDKREEAPQPASSQTTDSQWVDDGVGEKAPTAAIVFGRKLSGLTFAVDRAPSKGAQPGDRLVAVVDVGKLGPVFSPLDLERQRSTVKRIAEDKGLMLVLAKGSVIASSVVDITDEVLKALPPGGPVSQ